MSLRPRVRHVVFGYVVYRLFVAAAAFGQPMGGSNASHNPYAALTPSSSSYGTYPATESAPVVTQWPASYPAPNGMPVSDSSRSPTSASWIVPMDQQPGCVDADVYCDGNPYLDQSMFAAADAPWTWQMLPVGIIYHSYWAGVHEPRMGVQLMRIQNTGDSYWDPTIGARVGLLRFGNEDALHPQGWQVDVEGAAMPRLTLDDVRDLETVDFRGGVPLTYGRDNWQFKFGYYHLSSHLGDEFAIRNPGSLADRVNYVRDSLLLGASYYPIEAMRLYGEVGYAFNATDGAKPWEIEFGTELSKAGPTGNRGTPFLALNGHLREDHNFGGDFTAEAGWLWRNPIGQTLRLGAFYFNGKSSQYETYDTFEEQIGAGLWFDF
jgi:hypothetical protein